MRLPAILSLTLIAIPGALPSAAAAQGNPWRMDLGPYRAVAVTWRASGDITADTLTLGSASSTGRALFTPTAVRMTFDMRFTIRGKTDSGTAWSVFTPDGEASDNGGSDTIRVEPSLRSSLAREFDALPAEGKRKVLANLRKLGDIAGDELDVLPTFFAEKTGTATVAGQTCDVYTSPKGAVCVLPRAPVVMLRWSHSGARASELSATEVKFDVPVPANAFAYPTGKRVVRVPAEEAIWDHGWANNLFMERNDGNSPPSFEALARFVMRYLSTEDVEEAETEPGEP